MSIDPSNGLARYLDLAATESAFGLGMTAMINTDNGTVTADGNPVSMRSALVAQTSAPTMLVFIIRGLTANNITIMLASWQPEEVVEGLGGLGGSA